MSFFKSLIKCKLDHINSCLDALTTAYNLRQLYRCPPKHMIFDIIATSKQASVCLINENILYLSFSVLFFWMKFVMKKVLQRNMDLLSVVAKLIPNEMTAF